MGKRILIKGSHQVTIGHKNHNFFRIRKNNLNLFTIIKKSEQISQLLINIICGNQEIRESQTNLNSGRCLDRGRLKRER